jgi:hypothetical protein
LEVNSVLGPAAEEAELVTILTWLDGGSPPMDQTTNNQAADPAEDKDGNILVRDDGVRKADE